MRKALLLSLLLGCGARSTPATDALEKRLPLTSQVVVLDNGLRVVVQEDHRTPVVAVAVVYHAGSAADPPGKKGLAHLVEHMMFEGSKHVRRGELDDTLGEAGAAHKNAFTDVDVTLYHETIPSARLETALFLESDRMGFALDAHTPEVLESVRSVVVEELHQRYDHAPGGRAYSVLRRALYPKDHPYHDLPIGTAEDLARIQLADVRDFWLRNYGPDNATLVLVGDVRADQAVDLARKWFGPLPKGPPRPKLAPWIPALDKDVMFTLEADVELPELLVGWLTVPLTDPAFVDVAAMTHQMGWSVSGRLVKDKHLVRNVGAQPVSDLRAGSSVIQLKLEPGSTPEKVLEEMDVALANMSKYLHWTHGDDDVKEALYDDYTKAVYDLDGLEQRARTFGLCDLQFGDPRCTPRLLRDLERVTKDKVVETFRLAILNGHRVVVHTKPTPGAPMGGRLVGGS